MGACLATKQWFCAKYAAYNFRWLRPQLASGYLFANLGLIALMAEWAKAFV